MDFSTFSHIIITAPTDSICEIYQVQLESLKKEVPWLKATSVLCTPDPHGCRIGSGGGTINALSAALSHFRIDLDDATKILILHSGGDSRRAPLNSLCGKAWSSISHNGVISCPLMVLIAEISAYCNGIAGGTCVVGSSDVFLDLLDVDSTKKVHINGDYVTILTVPAPENTAKNHGVIVGPKDVANFSSMEAIEYLQKPSVEEMIRKEAIVALANKRVAMIDTGVVIFAGAAYKKLAGLCHDPAFKQCIRLSMTRDEPTLRFELYSELLLALRCRKTGGGSYEDYCQRIGYRAGPIVASAAERIYDAAVQALWRCFHDVPLYFSYFSDGHFEHLGTTREMIQLLTGATHSAFFRKFSMRFKTQSIEVEAPSADSGTTAAAIVGDSLTKRYCLLNSVVVDRRSGDSAQAPVSIVEHSLLSFASVGSGCIVSHIGGTLGRELFLPDHHALQQVHLSYEKLAEHRGDLSTATSWHRGRLKYSLPSCAMLLHVEDDVKCTISSSTGLLFQRSAREVLEVIGCDLGELWPTSISANDRCIWNAMLFPMFIVDKDTSQLHVFDSDRNGWEPAEVKTLLWMSALSDRSLEQISTDCQWAITQWRRCARCSLADFLLVGDAHLMFYWRFLLECVTKSCSLYRSPRSLQLSQQDSRQRFLPYDEIDAAFHAVAQWRDFTQQASNINWPCRSPFSLLLFWWCLSFYLDSQLHPAFLEAMCDEWDSAMYDTGMAYLALFHQLRDHLSRVASCDSTLLWVQLLRQLVHVDEDIQYIAAQLLRAVGTHCTNLARVPRFLLMLAWLLRGTRMERASMIAAVQLKERISASDCTASSMQEAFQAVAQSVLQAIESPSVEEAVEEGHRLCDALEDLAQAFVTKHIQYSIAQNEALFSELQHLHQVTNTSMVAAVASSPVRIDIAGGWSDTPPICYDCGGAVLNLSVLVDDQHPIKCASRVTADCCIRIHAVKLVDGAPQDAVSECRESASVWNDLGPNSPHALVKAALLALHLVPALGDTSLPLAEFLRQRWGGGVEIATISTLPAGSGMGGSSVLAATILKSLIDLLDLDFAAHDVVDLVSHVEQILTTGGGWQDQIGSIFGGFKLGKSAPSLPLAVRVRALLPSSTFRAALESRLFLVYTGTQRLAKHTLIHALRKYAITAAHSDHELHQQLQQQDTVSCLTQEARAGFAMLEEESSIICSEDSSSSRVHEVIDKLGGFLSRYWDLKKEMAAGSEPEDISKIFAALRPLSAGLSLCGAGAGGFAAVIMAQGRTEADLRSALESLGSSGDHLSVHRVRVDNSGIVCGKLPYSENILELLK